MMMNEKQESPATTSFSSGKMEKTGKTGESAPIFSPGERVGQRYVMRTLLGRGGMGEAWLADELGNERQIQEVVIKIVPRSIQESRQEMEKLRELFRLSRKLRHPNISTVLTIGEDERYGAFLVLDYVAGESLAAYQRRQPMGIFSLEATLEILAPLASALDFAHGQRVVHRDIKPQNVMIPEEALTSRHNEVKLIDFGLAAELLPDADSDSSRLSTAEKRRISGTIPYMPPEQILGKSQDGHTDQYALAVMAYKMLGGELPFYHLEAKKLMQMILHQPPKWIDALSVQGNRVLERGLSKNPEERFSSCAEFVAAFTRKEPPRVPPPVPYRGPEDGFFQDTLWDSGNKTAEAWGVETVAGEHFSFHENAFSKVLEQENSPRPRLFPVVVEVDSRQRNKKRKEILQAEGEKMFVGFACGLAGFCFLTAATVIYAAVTETCPFYGILPSTMLYFVLFCVYLFLFMVYHAGREE